MSYEIYKILHITGLLAIFLAYGLLIARAMMQSDDATVRKWSAILSGIALLIMLVSGFGMIAKKGFAMLEWWLVIKYLLWLVLGAFPVLVKKKPALATVWTFVLLAVGLIGVILGANHANLG